MLLFHAVLLILVQISDCVLDWVSCWVCIKPDALLLLRKFWRTKQFIIFDESHFCRNKKMMLCIILHISFSLLQDNQYLADRRLHRTNDPVCFPRCRQHIVCHIYVCCIRPCMPGVCFHVTSPVFVSSLSCHSTYQHGRIHVEYGQKDRDHLDN